ncbi:MAG TPA: SAM-dependent chlorinase/fluorinase [Anaeromyxobacteraceae bacterium]|nr:SAM-dependent chlorinase/fluorinase [Anaeromyxobacteraceae bacterium]
MARAAKRRSRGRGRAPGRARAARPGALGRPAWAPPSGGGQDRRPERPIVTLLSDFTYRSAYPAQMKAVVLQYLPDAQIVDLSHEVPPFDVISGALLLEACAPRFPARAVHCAVVDPGVGTARRPVCVVDAAGHRFVGPDNGLFTPFLGPAARVFELSDRRVVPAPESATFHGRDLFAPVAAWLAGGGDPARLGPRIRDPVRADWPEPRRRSGTIEGVCLAADPFGNIVTNIAARHLAGGRVREVSVAGRAVRFVRTYGEGAPGEILALLGSNGRLEVAEREGNAARHLSALRGTPVVVGLG